MKRAQYEVLAFSLTPRGIHVRINSHANPEEHEYLVAVANRIPISCTCPADANYGNACKHCVTVATRRPLLDVATQQQLVADGGIEIISSTGGDEENEDKDARDFADLTSDFPCWECYRSGRRDFLNNLV